MAAHLCHFAILDFFSSMWDSPGNHSLTVMKLVCVRKSLLAGTSRSCTWWRSTNSVSIAIASGLEQPAQPVRLACPKDNQDIKVLVKYGIVSVHFT